MESAFGGSLALYAGDGQSVGVVCFDTKLQHSGVLAGEVCEADDYAALAVGSAEQPGILFGQIF